MVEIKLKIEEKFKKDYETISGTLVEVDIEEIGKKATKNENEVTEIIKKRIYQNGKKEVINISKRKQTEDLKEFIENLLSI